jgi:hypothetical protein
MTATANTRRENPKVERSSRHGMFVVERRYDARPALVFAAWASPEAKSRWFHGPRGEWTENLRELDFRVGGRERLLGTRMSTGHVHAFDARYYASCPMSASSTPTRCTWTTSKYRSLWRRWSSSPTVPVRG